MSLFLSLIFTMMIMTFDVNSWSMSPAVTRQLQNNGCMFVEAYCKEKLKVGFHRHTGLLSRQSQANCGT